MACVVAKPDKPNVAVRACRYAAPELNVSQIVFSYATGDGHLSDDSDVGIDEPNILVGSGAALDVTARSLFALVEPGSCFAGSILETALASDRTYALDDPGRPVRLALSPLKFGALPMGHGLTRLQTSKVWPKEDGSPARLL